MRGSSEFRILQWFSRLKKCNKTSVKSPIVNSYIRLFRIGNCVMGVIGLLLGAFIAVDFSLTDYGFELAVASAVVFLFIAAGNSLNDYMDREVDKRAHPERPIPSGQLSPGAVLSLSAGMFSVAFFLTLFLDWISILIVTSAIAIMLAYEVNLKRKPLGGNLMIAWLTGGLFLLGGAVVGDIYSTATIASMAFLATLGREVLKDIEDMEADFDRNTLPMSIGRRRAGVIGSLSFLLAVGLSFIPYVDDQLGLGYLILVLVADAIFIYSAYIHFESPEKGQRWAKNAMAVALVAFLMGGII